VAKRQDPLNKGAYEDRVLLENVRGVVDLGQGNLFVQRNVVKTRAEVLHNYGKPWTSVLKVPAVPQGVESEWVPRKITSVLNQKFLKEWEPEMENNPFVFYSDEYDDQLSTYDAKR